MVAYFYWLGAFVVRGINEVVAMILADSYIAATNNAITDFDTPAANECRSYVAIEVSANLHLSAIEQLNIAPISKPAPMKDKL